MFSAVRRWFGSWSPDDVARKVKQVQDYTAATCQIVPEASAVAIVITAGNPTVLTAAALANSICTAVLNSRQKFNLVGSEPNGVVVEGVYIPIKNIS